MKTLSDFTAEATKELYIELRNAISTYVSIDSQVEEKHDAWQTIREHLLNQSGNMINTRTIAKNAAWRKKQAEIATKANGRPDYSLKRRAAVLKMARDRDRQRPIPKPITEAEGQRRTYDDPTQPF